MTQRRMNDDDETLFVPKVLCNLQFFSLMCVFLRRQIWPIHIYMRQEQRQGCQYIDARLQCPKTKEHKLSNHVLKILIAPSDRKLSSFSLTVQISLGNCFSDEDKFDDHLSSILPYPVGPLIGKQYHNVLSMFNKSLFQIS
jgi:hypothetical protein